jgi:DMSO/TMAO reductase YedYZ heme-binding membrane subunit
VGEHLWWYVARASGMVAWALLTLSILWGFFVTTRVLGGRPRPVWLLDLHRFLGGLAVVFVGVHLAGLYLDQFIGFSLADLSVPFVSSYEPIAMALGIVALYVLVAVEITSLLMSRMPRTLWKWIHRASYVLFACATVHSLLIGSDARNAVAIWLLGIGISEVTFLVIVRLVVRGRGEVAQLPG